MDLAKNNVSLTNCPKLEKAVEIRRKIAEKGNIDFLDKIEKQVFLSSTNNLINEIPDSKLIETLAQLLKYICDDVGINKVPDQYEATRITDILKRYYSNFSLAEIKLAFELSLVGELDDYLPRGRDSKADNNHYQKFNIDYLTKILNAYRNYQNKVLFKVYDSLPEETINEEYKIKLYHNLKLHNIYDNFKNYYNTGTYNANALTDNIIYDFLQENNLSFDIKISEKDKQRAVLTVLNKVHAGLFDRMTGEKVRKEKTSHEAVEREAFIKCRKESIKKSFDKIIKNKIDIKKYLKFYDL